MVERWICPICMRQNLVACQGCTHCGWRITTTTSPIRLPKSVQNLQDAAKRALVKGLGLDPNKPLPETTIGRFPKYDVELKAQEQPLTKIFEEDSLVKEHIDVKDFTPEELAEASRNMLDLLNSKEGMEKLAQQADDYLRKMRREAEFLTYIVPPQTIPIDDVQDFPDERPVIDQVMASPGVPNVGSVPVSQGLPTPPEPEPENDVLDLSMIYPRVENETFEIMQEIDPPRRAIRRIKLPKPVQKILELEAYWDAKASGNDAWVKWWEIAGEKEIQVRPDFTDVELGIHSDKIRVKWR